MSICDIKHRTQRIEDKKANIVCPDIIECNAGKYDSGVTNDVWNEQIYRHHLGDVATASAQNMAQRLRYYIGEKIAPFYPYEESASLQFMQR